MLAAWASIRARTNGCAAAMKEITSSRNVRNPAQRRRMWHASYIPAGKDMAGTPQPAQFGNPKLHFAVLPPWAPAASPSSTGRGAREVPRQAPPVLALGPPLTTSVANEPRPPESQGSSQRPRTFFKPLFLVTSALWCAHARPGPTRGRPTIVSGGEEAKRHRGGRRYNSRLLRPGPTQHRPFQTAPSSTSSCSVKSARAVSAFK